MTMQDLFDKLKGVTTFSGNTITIINGDGNSVVNEPKSMNITDFRQGQGQEQLEWDRHSPENARYERESLYGY